MLSSAPDSLPLSKMGFKLPLKSLWLSTLVNQVWIRGSRVGDAGNGAEVCPNRRELIYGHAAECWPRHDLKDGAVRLAVWWSGVTVGVDGA